MNRRSSYQTPRSYSSHPSSYSNNRGMYQYPPSYSYYPDHRYQSRGYHGSYYGSRGGSSSHPPPPPPSRSYRDRGGDGGGFSRRDYFRNKSLPLCKCGRRCRMVRSQSHRNKFYFTCFLNRCEFSLWEDEFAKDENRVNVESNKEFYYLVSNKRCGQYLRNLERFVRMNIVKVLKNKASFKEGEDLKDELFSEEVTELYNKLRKAYTDYSASDEKIYDELRELLYPKNSNETIGKPVEESNDSKDVVCNFIGGKELKDRGEFRFKGIEELLPSDFTPTSLLDYGCGDGSITKIMGKKWNIESERLHGVDVVPMKKKKKKKVEEDDEEEEEEENDDDEKEEDDERDSFNYVMIDPEKEKCELESIKDDSVDIIVALMSLHHVKNLESTLEELYRILDKEKGILVIREHDLENSDFGIYLDIVHGLYGLVFSNPAENPKWRKNYHAKFFSLGDWKKIMDKKNFVMLDSSKCIGIYRSFYMALIPNNEEHVYHNIIRKTQTKRSRHDRGDEKDLDSEERRKRRRNY